MSDDLLLGCEVEQREQDRGGILTAVEDAAFEQVVLGSFLFQKLPVGFEMRYTEKPIVSVFLGNEIHSSELYGLNTGAGYLD